MLDGQNNMNSAYLVKAHFKKAFYRTDSWQQFLRHILVCQFQTSEFNVIWVVQNIVCHGDQQPDSGFENLLRVFLQIVDSTHDEILANFTGEFEHFTLIIIWKNSSKLWQIRILKVRRLISSIKISTTLKKWWSHAETERLFCWKTIWLIPRPLFSFQSQPVEQKLHFLPLRTNCIILIYF